METVGVMVNTGFLPSVRQETEGYGNVHVILQYQLNGSISMDGSTHICGIYDNIFR